MKIKLETTKIGQSNTDYRLLDDIQLAEHIAILAAKRPHNWTPTFSNLRGARGHMLGRIGARQGFRVCGERVRRGDRVALLTAPPRPLRDSEDPLLWEGEVESITPSWISVRGPSPFGGDRIGCTMIEVRDVQSAEVL